LIGAALIIQVIGHRMIMTATLFQILYVFYVLKYYDKSEKFKLLITFGMAVLFLFFYIYIFVDLITNSNTKDDIILIFTSNKIFNYLTL
jgi:hypothetical protein